MRLLACIMMMFAGVILHAGEYYIPEVGRSVKPHMKVVQSEQREGYECRYVEFDVEKGERISAYLLVPDGASRRSRKPAVVMLHDHGFTGKLIERERIHRVAEGYAMMYLAGLAVNPLQIPKLQQETIQNLFLEKECYYGSKQLKEVSSLEMNKNAYTRIVGAVFANKNVYAVYNTRHQIMKWNGRGEKKTLINLEEISRMNANVYRVTSAILLGKNTKVILETLRETEETKRLEFCFDGIYTHIHFVPMDANGVRQLRLLCLEDWREELLSALFPDEMRSYDQGGFEYDASIGRKFILTFFDGDIARLQRFRYAAQRTSGEYEVLCFPFQVELIKGYLGVLTIKYISK